MPHSITIGVFVGVGLIFLWVVLTQRRRR
jgi:hypothetical protein